jgi:hypothetical protein
MLTLESAVDILDVDMRPLMKELFFSTPNLAKEPCMRKSSSVTPMRPSANLHFQHFRSTSYNLPLLQRRLVISSPPVMEAKGCQHTSDWGFF